MDDPPVIEILVLFFLVLLNGFFSMSEMSIVSSRKARLRAKADEGRKAYRRALDAAENPTRYLSTIQIGITLIGILSGAFGGATIARTLSASIAAVPLLAPWAEGLAVAIVVISITFLSIVVGELVPKQIALSKPEAIAAAVVPLLSVLSRVFSPIVGFLSRATNLVLKLFRIPTGQDHAITEEEIHIALSEGERYGIVEKKERSMVEGVFYLGDRPVETFMMHRSELVWLEADASADETKAAVLSARHQAFFPIAKGGLDNVVGVASIRDVLAAFVDGSWRNVADLAKKPCFVPSTMSSLKAFESFKRSGSEFILVLDEYGGLAGAISIRDLIEEIVGELSTPDADSEEIIKREDGSYLIGGLVNADEFAELFDIVRLLPEKREYHTVAGFILAMAGSIPRTGDVYEWEGYRFEIVDMDGNRIDKIIVQPPLPTLPV
ncbi:MAG: hypothetical protein A2413_05915 [Treponema sp. RIFOXYC1_FULL_61_9]|nr:MAG: hypothetical protein A2001_20410 [Treponema sp. GWC1_61_84]OHE74782.1 MAG: hypothetical protein A2413_05915 [Treponema sp. RIFOXYC1_FULL_61_9]